MNSATPSWQSRDDALALLPSVARRANRRRLRVFLATLLVALVVSLGITWLRAPEYRASVRLEIVPARIAPVRPGPNEGATPFLTEVQVLTSRPVLQEVAERLTAAGQSLEEFGPDPVAGMQRRIEARPVPETNVVELVATGQHAGVLAPLLNGIVDVYQRRLVAAYDRAFLEARAQADSEVERLDATVQAKRREVERLRLSSNIISLEADQNAVLARVRDQSASMSAASDRVAKAEARLQALNDAAAAGRSVITARDNPTLAAIEAEAAQNRAKLRDLERSFTPEFLDRDPDIRAMRARLAELDQQIAIQRAQGSRDAQREAEQELASARGAQKRIDAEIAADRQTVAHLATRFNEFKAQQEDLAKLEEAYRDATQRRAKLEATERERMPGVKLLEVATTPAEPWRPLYWRDSGIAAAGSLVLALLAMWLVELFNRSDPQPTTMILAERIGGERLPMSMPPPLLGGRAEERALAHGAPALLGAPAALPRELTPAEIGALLAAADADARLLALLLLAGLDQGEVTTLRWADVHPERGTIAVPGASPREVPTGPELRSALAARSGAADALVLGSTVATSEAIDRALLCAAHDAGIERATEVTAAALRHTYIAYLVRQGLRFSELAAFVGTLPVGALSTYSGLTAPRVRVGRDRVDAVFPVERQTA